MLAVKHGTKIEITILFTIGPRNIKCLGVKLTKQVQAGLVMSKPKNADERNERCKQMQRHTMFTEDNTVKMSIIPKLI